MALLVEDFEKGKYSEQADLFRRIRDEAKDVKIKTALGKGSGTDTRDPKTLVRHQPEKAVTADFAAFDPREQMIGNTGDILTAETFEIGMLVRRMVVQIKKPNGKNATGFFVGKDLMMTNNHVIRSQADADLCQIVCGNVECFYTPDARYFSFLRCDAKSFFFTDEKLDLTVIAVHDPRENPPEDAPTVADYGYLPLIEAQGKAVHGDPLNVIHYPQGLPCRVTMHNGHLIYLEDKTELDPYFWHTCDTLKGSSGAPVMNRMWEVVGLHSSGVPDTNTKGEVLDKNGKPISEDRFRRDPDAVNWIANQGTRASRIVRALREADLDDDMSTRRDGLLELWEQPNASLHGLRQTQAATARIMQPSPSHQTPTPSSPNQPTDLPRPTDDPQGPIDTFEDRDD
ncbi:MAG: serine protease [Pseudomonadota bacterium]